MTTATAAKKQASKFETLQVKNYIGGKWVAGSKTELKSMNPADTRETVAVVSAASRIDAVKAIDAAEKAFPAWRATPAPLRGRIVAKALEIARARRVEIGTLLTREEGKILSEGIGEVDKGNNLLEWFAGEGLRFMGHTAPSELPSNLLYTIRQPLGVVSVITPWNFPWAIPCWKIAPALVAGNTVVFKPSEITFAVAAEMVKCFEEAGLPAGVLNMVVGDGPELGEPLTKDGRIKAISFTGSNEVGRLIHKVAGERGIRVTCEMGGKNACVVMNDADLDLALAGVMKGAYGSTGQRCTATSRLIVQKEVTDAFLGRLKRAVQELKVGNGLDPAVNVGPAVDKFQYDQDLEYIEVAKKEGAELITGGRSLKDGDLKHGYFVEPTLFDGGHDLMRVWHEEIFGPVLLVSQVKTLDEAIAQANSTRFGLTTSIYTKDFASAMRYVDEAEFGMVHVNSPTIGGEPQIPFGGSKDTGVGHREMAKEGIEFFSDPKSVFLDYTGAARKSNIY